MAEQASGQERTEQPTPRRLQKALEEGQVARSQELSGAVVLLGGTLVLGFSGGDLLARKMMELMWMDASWLVAEPVDLMTAAAMLRLLVQQILLALIPFAIAATAVAVLVNAVQARGVLSLKPVTPKLDRVSPLSGMKRLFSMQAPFTLLKAILKLTFLSVITYLTIRSAWQEITSLSGVGAAAVLLVVKRLAFKVAFVTGLSFVVIAALDYMFQLYQHARQLRMTKQEVVREHKDTEGDPLIKSRIRSLARSLNRSRMMADVPKADVVVTNPTHLAVALKYDPTVSMAPVVLAMGKRKLAQRIKEIAKASGVPLVENKPLAQALVATSTVGQSIPPQLYLAVAEVIAFVYKKRNRTRLSPALPSGGIS